jgi:hypothetical protein
MILATGSAESGISYGREIGFAVLETPSNQRSTHCSAISVILSIGITILVITAATLILASLSFANDSFGRLGAGGITFVKTQDVRILEEVLTISTDLIRVKYRFLNESDRDIRTTIAFPLPLRGIHSGVRYYGGAIESSEQIRRSFSVRVNGISVETRYDRKAIIGDTDITAQLRQIGLTDEQIFETFAGCEVDSKGLITWDLPFSQQVKITKLLGELTKGDSPWKVSETIYWEQLFPAKKELVVEHTYTPMPGGRYDVPYQEGFGYVSPADYLTIYMEDPCLNDTTRRNVANRLRYYVDRGVGWLTVYDADVEYILGTGRNWKGPIGLFKLRIKKKPRNQFISHCFPGKPREINPTTYEFVRKDYTPPDRLIVNFYTVEPRPLAMDRTLKDDEMLLLWAAHAGRQERVKGLLDNGVDINAKSQAGWTPLMWAVETGHIKIVKMLLDRGALTNLKNKKGLTALKLAETNGYEDIEALLKGKGAKE